MQKQRVELARAAHRDAVVALGAAEALDDEPQVGADRYL